MSEIRHKQVNASPEIDYGEIYIPDDRNLGTGIFKTIIKPGAFASLNPIFSVMINAPSFQISLNLNPLTGEIPVLLGLANGSDPLSSKTYLFPRDYAASDSHEFEVTFKDWGITGLLMDKIPLYTV